MKMTFLALTAGLGVAGFAFGTPPSPPASEQPAAPAAVDSGKVIVLTTEQLLEGDITRVGDQYRVRRAIGESFIPAEQVLKLVQDRKEACEVIRQRSNPRDPDERLRVARWCLLYGLRDEALAEAQAAVRLRPTNAEAQTMVRGLERLKAAPPPMAEPEATPAAPAAVAEVAPPPDFNSAAYGLFVAKVQPLLMNTCASCHAGGKGGGFTLVRVFDGPSNRRGTLFNLTATLGQLSRERPHLSPLLLRSVSAHGDAAKPPIKSIDAPAFKLLESWAQFALAPDGTPKSDVPLYRIEPAEETDLPSGVAVSHDAPQPLPKPPRLPGPRKENTPELKGRLLGYQNGMFVGKPRTDQPADEPRQPADTAKPQPKQPPTSPTGFAEASKAKPPEKPAARAPIDEFDPAIFNNLGKTEPKR